MTDRVRILGRLGSADGKGVVRMEDRFATDIDDLWSALTERDRLARWLGEFEGELRVGGTFRAHYFTSGWTGSGRVDECEPPHRFLIHTKGDDAVDEGAIEATLRADGDGTLLVVEQHGMPLDMIAGYGAGIQIHVEDLAVYINGSDRPDMDARFEELFAAYQQLPKPTE